jgi:3-dehydroquinate synthetase
LPIRIDQVSGGTPTLSGLMDLIAQDKKVSRGKLTFILARGIGNAFVATDVEGDDVRAYLAEKLNKR